MLRRQSTRKPPTITNAMNAACSATTASASRRAIMVYVGCRSLARLVLEHRLQVGEGTMGSRCRRSRVRRGVPARRMLQLPLVLVVVAIDAQELPIAAVGRVVVVIVIAVMDGKLAHRRAVEFAPAPAADPWVDLQRLFARSEEHTSELQSRRDLVCRLLLEKKKKKYIRRRSTKNKKSNT